MMRSFGYVQQSALRSVAHNDAEAARLSPLARAWELYVSTAFLTAYDAAAFAKRKMTMSSAPPF